MRTGLFLLLLTLSLGAAAQQQEKDEVTIYFRVDESAIDSTYLGNARSLGQLDSLVMSFGTHIDSIAFISYASPEGTATGNIALSRERASCVSAYLASRWPAIHFGPVSVRSGGPDYQGLKERLEADDNIPARNHVLSLLEEMDADAPRTIYLLKRLQGGVPYSYIRDQHLPWLRRARLVIYHSVPLPLQANILAETNTNILNTHELVSSSLPRSDAQGTRFAEEERAGREKKTPLLAVSTNLVMEAATVLADFHTVPLNLGLELPLGKHWSVFADYTVTVPWQAYNDNADCFQLMQAHLGGRWYPSGKRPLGGWYVYAQAGGGYYDFERDGKGYQGEDFLAAAGGGYSFAFGEHFRLNIGVGFGPILTQYRYYEGRMANQHLMYRYSGNLQYFGITDAKISLTWLFYRKKK